MSEQYKRNKQLGVGINLSSTLESKDMWRTPEDIARIKGYSEADVLYEGAHCDIDGGPFPHFYQAKFEKHKIPYRQINLLSKCSRTFANLLVGNPSDPGLQMFDSSDEGIESVLNSLDFTLPLWEALIQVSKFGFVGLVPVENELKTKGRNVSGQISRFNWEIILPECLYLEYNKATKKLRKIRKCIVFKKINIGTEDIDILFEENHYTDRIETRLYQVIDEKIIKELPLDYYRFIDEDNPPPIEVYQHDLGNFYITILANETLNSKYYSDYTSTAKKLQESLNNRLTQIDRILNLHADPRLVVPLSALKKDSENGEYDFIYAGSEVLVYDDRTSASEPYKLLTWTNELSQAVADRDNTILALLTEFDLAPQLLSFTRLVSGTVADTADKMEKMLLSTIQRCSLKQKNLAEALYKLCDNILLLQGFSDLGYTITLSETIPQNRNEIIDEQIQRKQSGLQSTKEALKIIDNLTEEQAIEKATEIFNEQANLVQNPFRFEQEGISFEQGNQQEPDFEIREVNE